jgi:hypothetical protein
MIGVGRLLPAVLPAPSDRCLRFQLACLRLRPRYWWCWNANSGDTGGIVAQASTKVRTRGGGSSAAAPPRRGQPQPQTRFLASQVWTPWYAIKWHKIRYLQEMGLCPWWMGSSCNYYRRK